MACLLDESHRRRKEESQLLLSDAALNDGPRPRAAAVVRSCHRRRAHSLILAQLSGYIAQQ